MKIGGGKMRRKERKLRMGSIFSGKEERGPSVLRKEGRGALPACEEHIWEQLPAEHRKKESNVPPSPQNHKGEAVNTLPPPAVPKPWNESRQLGSDFGDA